MYYYIPITERIYSDFCIVKRIFYRNHKPLNGYAPFFERLWAFFSKNERICSVFAILGVKGLSETSIGYTKRFYLLYNEWFTIYPQVVGELQDSAIWRILWGHHRYIIDKCFNEPEKAMFFVRKMLENGWSGNVLLNFMDNLYERKEL